MEQKEKRFFLDNIFVANIGTVLIYYFCVLLLNIITSAVGMPQDPFWSTFYMYFAFIIFWIVIIALLLLVKKDREFLKKLSFDKKTWKFAGIGLAIGLGMNLIGFLVAMLNKDVSIQYRGENIFLVILMFIAVMIQCGAEEILYRLYIYQHVKRGYKKEILAFSNAVTFSLLHLTNPGYSINSFLSIIIFGTFFSLFIYYFDSFWMAVMAHTAWNFSQSILLGLPNSGIKVGFSIFECDASVAKSSFWYDANFGIEGSFFTILMGLVAIGITILIGEKKRRAEAI